MCPKIPFDGGAHQVSILGHISQEKVECLYPGVNEFWPVWALFKPCGWGANFISWLYQNNVSWRNENLHLLHDMLSTNLLLLVAFIMSALPTDAWFVGLILLGMNTSHLSHVWLAFMVANGDDTNGLEHSPESAAAARWTHTHTLTFSLICNVYWTQL